MTAVVEERRAVRALILTPQREVLLMRIRAPQGGDPFWIAPGGGMEPDETQKQALKPTERMSPKALAAILDAYLSVGAPDPLPDEEVLVD